MIANAKAAALALMVLAGPATARELISVYKFWGTFRDASPARCYAISRPITARGRGGGFASIADWPHRALRNSLHLRLSRARDTAVPVTLSIGDRRFALVGAALDAWAADAASDRAIASAMRGGRSMSVEAVAPGGRPFADVYALAGAATAMDAAALACATR